MDQEKLEIDAEEAQPNSRMFFIRWKITIKLTALITWRKSIEIWPRGLSGMVRDIRLRIKELGWVCRNFYENKIEFFFCRGIERLGRRIESKDLCR